MVARRPDDDGFADWVRTNVGPQEFDPEDADDIRVIRRFGIPERTVAGTILFREGDVPSALFVVEEGEVELFFERRDERRIMQVCGPGSSIGDLPVMLALPAYAYGAAARTEARLLRFPMETIRALVDVNSQICFRFLRVVSRRLERAERRLLELSGRSALEQIVQYLVREARERGSDTVIVSQTDIAAALGVSRQTVSRVLGELEALALLSRGRRQLHIIDHERLKAIADPTAAHD